MSNHKVPVGDYVRRRAELYLPVGWTELIFEKPATKINHIHATWLMNGTLVTSASNIGKLTMEIRLKYNTQRYTMLLHALIAIILLFTVFMTIVFNVTIIAFVLIIILTCSMAYHGVLHNRLMDEKKSCANAIVREMSMLAHDYSNKETKALYRVQIYNHQRVLKEYKHLVDKVKISDPNLIVDHWQELDKY